MGMVLIECSSGLIDVAKAALANAGGKLHGVFQDIGYDVFWLKAELPSCAKIAEGARIPVVAAFINEADGAPVLSVSHELNMGPSFRLVQEVK
jgi:hypothetical protein